MNSEQKTDMILAQFADIANEAENLKKEFPDMADFWETCKGDWEKEVLKSAEGDERYQFMKEDEVLSLASELRKALIVNTAKEKIMDSKINVVRRDGIWMATYERYGAIGETKDLAIESLKDEIKWRGFYVDLEIEELENERMELEMIIFDLGISK